MNGATLPPWMTPWAGGLMYGPRVYKPGSERGPRDRLRPRLTIFTLGHDNSAPILSWSDSTNVVAEPGEVDGGASAAPARGRAGPVRWERVPLDRPPWHVDVPVPVHTEIMERHPRFDSTEAEDGAAAWGGVVRGWAAGAALLALLVLLARALERFIDWKEMLRRRRIQREWQRANVRATLRTEEGFVIPPGDDSHPDLGPCSVELPPPYSEVSAAPTPKDEEPPPPYVESGDSCVQIVNKDGVPVMLFNRLRTAGDPAGRHHLERILNACGLSLAPGQTAADVSTDLPADLPSVDLNDIINIVDENQISMYNDVNVLECAEDSAMPVNNGHAGATGANDAAVIEVTGDDAAPKDVTADDAAPKDVTGDDAAPKDGAVLV